MIRIMQDMKGTSGSNPFAFINCHGQQFFCSHFRLLQWGLPASEGVVPLALLARGLTMAVPESSPYDCWERARVDPVVFPEQFAQVRTIFGYGSLIFRPGFQYKRTGSCCLGGFGNPNQLDILGGWWASFGRAWPQLFFFEPRLCWAIRIRKPCTNAWAPFDGFSLLFMIVRCRKLLRDQKYFTLLFFTPPWHWALLTYIRGGIFPTTSQEVPCCRPRLCPALLATFLWSSRNSRSTRHGRLPWKSHRERISFQAIIFQGLGELLNFRGWFSITCLIICM